MRAFLHVKTGQAHQAEAMLALASGLAMHGIKSVSGDYTCPVPETDFIVWWGDKAPPILRDQYPRLILEAGFINGRSGDYVQDRLAFVSAGWSGLHGRADPGPPDRPPSRWQALDQALLPWREDGEIILICGQHPGDTAAPSSKHWSQGAIGMGAQAGLPVVYRPHPLMAPDLKPLAWSLNRAAICVTWSSTCAIEAVIMGVPTIALDRGSMAWPVTSHDFADPFFLGERDQWAYNLAYRQWTHEELADGSAWEHMRYGIETSNPA